MIFLRNLFHVDKLDFIGLIGVATQVSRAHNRKTNKQVQFLMKINNNNKNNHIDDVDVEVDLTGQPIERKRQFNRKKIVIENQHRNGVQQPQKILIKHYEWGSATLKKKNSS